MMPDQTPAFTAAEFGPIMRDMVPYVGQLGIETVSWQRGRVMMRLPASEVILRPGGTVCGPALFALADIAFYGMIMSMLGRVDLAVTTDLTIHFLRRPRPVSVLGEARCLKQGGKLIVGDMLMWSEGDGPDNAVCHAVGTYALPPSGKIAGSEG
jgi:uncharacterized protein (TIGR00369 family)